MICGANYSTVPLFNEAMTDDKVSLSDAETSLGSLSDEISQLENEMLLLESDYDSLFGSLLGSSQLSTLRTHQAISLCQK